MPDNEVQVQFKAVITDFLGGLKSAVDSVKESTEGMKGDIGSLAESIEKMGAATIALVGVGLAFEGIKEAVSYVAEAVRETHELAEEFKMLGYATGASLEQLNQYTAAMELSGKSAGDLNGLMVGMQRGIKANANVLIANGVAANKAALDGMSFEDYLRRVHDLADQMATPTEREQFLILALGRSGAQSGAMLGEFIENLEKAKDLTKDGGIINDKSMQNLHDSNAAMGRLKIAQQEYAAQVSASATPIMDWWHNLRASILEAQTEQSRLSELQRAGLITQHTYYNGGVEDATTLLAKMRQITAEQKEMDRNDVTAHLGKAPEAPKTLVNKSDMNAQKAAQKAAAEEAKKAAEALSRAIIDIEKDTEETKIKLDKDGEKERAAGLKSFLAMNKETARAEIEDAKSVFDQRKAFDAQEVAMGRMTKTQELNDLKKALEEESKAELAAITKEQQYYTKASLEYKKMEDQKVQIARRAEDEIAKYQNDKLRIQADQYKQFFGALSSSFGNAVKGMITGQQTFSQAMEQMEKQALANLAKSALTYIGNQAAKAAAGAAASAASDGPTGWAMAIPIAMSVLSSVMGLQSSVASAEGGFDIPAGMNPVTQLHEKEMVLPAEHADTIRGLKGGGGAIHLHVQAMDAKSFAGFLHQNQGALSQTLRTMARNGRV